MGGLFINYRRDDSAAYAGRLHDALRAHFSKEHIFMDIEDIEPGRNFSEVIEHSLAACEVLLVLMGKDWVNMTDAAGRRRLDNPDDYVRLEIETALKRKMRVIPVLVEGATMPSAQELPDTLAELTMRNAVELSDTRWNYDTGRLIEVLKKILKAEPKMLLPSFWKTLQWRLFLFFVIAGVIFFGGWGVKHWTAETMESVSVWFGLIQYRKGEEEFRKNFGLDERWRPLTYIENDFEDQGDVVIDHATGLMWQKSGSDERMPYEEAHAYIQELNGQKFAGYNDWRLSTIAELMSLLEREKQSNGLFINPIFDAEQDWCWSADKSSTESAWFVYFDLGYVYWDLLLDNFRYDGYVRAVRP